MKQPITLAILGDICPDWGFRDSFDKKDAALIFGDVLPLLQNADYAVGNLEAPASDRGAPISKCGPCLRCKPDDLAVLKTAGFHALSLANNHIMDYGTDALCDTIRTAQALDVSVFGAGMNSASAKQPLFVQVKGWKLGFLSFAEQEFNCADADAAGANLFDPYVSFMDIQAAKAQCDYLTVLYHGGIEHYIYPSPLLQKKCRAMACAGADLVLCQHSHCIGTQEQYEKATILYGQGNAIFGRKKSEKWNTGLLISVQLSENGSTCAARVFEAGEKGIHLLSAQASDVRLERLRHDSACLNDSKALKHDWDSFCAAQAAEYLPLLLGWGRISNKLNRIFHGCFTKHLISKRKKMVAMNLIRCDAHHEVVTTILENSQK